MTVYDKGASRPEFPLPPVFLNDPDYDMLGLFPFLLMRAASSAQFHTFVSDL